MTRYRIAVPRVELDWESEIPEGIRLTDFTPQSLIGCSLALKGSQGPRLVRPAEIIDEDCSSVALRGEEAVGICVLVDNRRRRSLVMLDVLPAEDAKRLSAVMLARTLEQMRRYGYREIDPELLDDDHSGAVFLEALGFDLGESLDGQIPALVKVASFYNEMGQVELASRTYLDAASLWRQAKDPRAEGLEFLAAQLTSKNLLYWLDLSEGIAHGEGTEHRLEAASEGAFWELAPLTEQAFADPPGRLRAYHKNPLADCSILARDGTGAVVGGCVTLREDRGAVICLLVVGASARRSGLGKAMLGRSLQLLQELGCRAVHAHVLESNVASRRTFESLGFTVVSTLEQALALGRKSGVLRFRDLLDVVGRENVEQAIGACWQHNIRVDQIPTNIHGRVPKYDSQRIRRFYDEYGALEWERLGPGASPMHRVNFHLHRHYLRRYIRPGWRVLEAGSGAGRFTLELAELMTKVTVGDISAKQLELAESVCRERDVMACVERFVQLDITDLSEFESNSFDAVVCYGGPLSYVFDQAPQALDHLLRVTRPEGVILLSVMSLVGSTQHLLPRVLDALSPQEISQVLRTGDLEGMGEHRLRMYRWSTLRQLLERDDCDIVATSASGHLCIGNEEAATRALADPDLKERYLQWEQELCAEEGALDGGTHILVVLQKR